MSLDRLDRRRGVQIVIFLREPESKTSERRRRAPAAGWITGGISAALMLASVACGEVLSHHPELALQFARRRSSAQGIPAPEFALVDAQTQRIPVTPSEDEYPANHPLTYAEKLRAGQPSGITLPKTGSPRHS